MAKNIGYFKSFMKNEVGLNKTRHNRLNRHVDSVRKFLESTDLRIKDIFPLGSYEQDTIIKPAKNNKEFDADVIVRMRVVDDWDARDYIETLYSIFKADSKYSSKVKRKSRCVTLNYAGDFHLDIVPLLKTRGFLSSTYYITNRNTNLYEPTNPYEYNDWLLRKNSIVGGNYFLESVMLFKYLRDTKQNFSVKSILLNTLLGMMVSDRDKRLSECCFSDLPTTFTTLFNRLNSWLQKQSEMPIIVNPSLKTEDFNRHWDEVKFQNFRTKINYYCDKVNKAYEVSNRKESLRKWKAIFGKKFGN